MSPKGLLVLAAVTMGAVALAAQAVMQRDLPISTVSLDQPLAPGLADRLDQVAQIRVVAAGRTATVRRAEAGWVVDELGGFPVDVGKVQTLARGLVTARVLEPKTDRPERHPRLELEEPTADKAKSRLVVLSDANGAEIVSVIVGKTRYGLFGPGRGGVYARRAGEARAWLLDRRIEIPEEPIGWIERRIVDVPREQVARVVLRAGTAEEVVAARAGPDATELTLEGVPEGRAVDKDKLERLAGTLSDLTLQEVKAASEVAFAADAPRARFETAEGLVVEAVVQRQGEGDDAAFWVKLEASPGTPRAGDLPPGAKPVAEQVAGLSGRLDGWAFKLPRWTAERLVWGRDDLLQPAAKTS
jgi:hypothetical protein